MSIQRRRFELAAIVRPRHLAHVQIAARVNPNAMRGDKLTRPLALPGVAQPRQAPSRQVVDADTCPQVGEPGIHSQARGQLSDIGPIALDVQPAGSV